MPQGDILITLKVERVDTKRQADVSFLLPANGAIGVAIAQAGKDRIGAILEQLGTLVDEHRTNL